MVPLEAEVRARTAQGVNVARDERTAVATVVAAAARSVLSLMPGMGRGDAFASAVCFAKALHRLAVYDRWARSALFELEFVLDSRVRPVRFAAAR